MSDLLRSALHERIARLPTLPHSSEDDYDDEEEAEAADGLGSLPGSGLGPPAMPRNSRAPPTRKPKIPNADFAPISAAGLFDAANQISVSAAGGQLTLDMRVYYTPPSKAHGTLMVCHHGAGYGGLSFACLAREVTAMTHGELGVMAFDARRHGKTTSSGDDTDLSVDTLVVDFVALLEATFTERATAPHLLLVGHSMGGAVVARAAPILIKSGFKLTGAAVLDVVEGTALDALPHMNSILNARPDGFDSVEEAIEWHVKSNTIRSTRSARISVPAIVRATSTPGKSPAYEWRTPLRSTASYWQSWFTGLSAAFLALPTARLLVLAGAERLDTPLMIGQMQGKFQLSVVPNVGHMLHEDDSIRVAEVLVEFWRRNERVVAGVKKVGEL